MTIQQGRDVIRRLRAIEGLTDSALRALSDSSGEGQWRGFRSTRERGRAARCLRRAEAVARNLETTHAMPPLPSLDPSYVLGEASGSGPEEGESLAAVRAKLSEAKAQLARRREQIERQALDSPWRDLPPLADESVGAAVATPPWRSVLGRGGELGWWLACGSLLALWALSGWL